MITGQKSDDVSTVYVITIYGLSCTQEQNKVGESRIFVSIALGLRGIKEECKFHALQPTKSFLVFEEDFSRVNRVCSGIEKTGAL